jgi:hypothetical protein
MPIELNKPIFIIGLCLMLLAFLAEVGSPLLGATPPGIGIPYIAILDILMMNGVVMLALALFSPNFQSKVNTISGLIISIIAIIGGIILILMAVVKLLIMVALLLAVPFGTLIYLALFGTFPKGLAATALGLIMFLKLAFGACLVLSEPEWLQKKGFLFLTLSSLLACLIVEFLHAIVPGFLCSVTDALAAIIVGIIGVIWAIVLLIKSIIAIINVV